MSKSGPTPPSKLSDCEPQSARDQPRSPARREFFKGSGLMIAGGAIGGSVAISKAVQGADTKPIKIGFVGCGRRARQLADALLSGLAHSGSQPTRPAVQVVALGDYFSAQTQSMYRSLKGQHAAAVSDRCVRASGIHAIDEVLHTDIDLVYLTAPPVFRPDHFAKAIQADKHAFLEKPLAADPSGVMAVMATGEQANVKNKVVHVGLQRRHDARYQEVVAAIHQGAIGQPVFARAFCNAGPLRSIKKTAKESDKEFELRNWNHFQWTGGDFLIEQHVSGLDVLRWAINDNPIEAQGQGGWGQIDVESKQPTGERLGQVFDHHSLEFQFPSGLVALSQCRRVGKAWNNTSEHLHGTEGKADITAGKIYDLSGNLIWQSEIASSTKLATAAQQAALIQAIREGRSENQVPAAVNSTLMAMLGHQATQTGKRTKWSQIIPG